MVSELIINKTRKAWTAVVVNTCPHSVTCNCLTDGVQQELIKEFRGHTLADGPIPKCCEEIRNIIHPDKTDEELKTLCTKK